MDIMRINQYLKLFEIHDEMVLKSFGNLKGLLSEQIKPLHLCFQLIFRLVSDSNKGSVQI